MYKPGDLFNSFEFVEEAEPTGGTLPNQLHPRVRYTLISYDRIFDNLYGDGGYGISVDANGKPVDPDKERRLAQLEQQAQDGELVDRGITVTRRTYTDPASIKCECGAEVVLQDAFTSTCEKCGRDYNGSGQLLAPRSQWGEETGEYLSDIINYQRADWDFD